MSYAAKIEMELFKVTFIFIFEGFKKTKVSVI